jgi:hypothetical protein
MQKFSIYFLLFIVYSSCSNSEYKPNTSSLGSSKEIKTTRRNEFVLAQEFYSGIHVIQSHPLSNKKIDTLSEHFDSLRIRVWDIAGLYRTTRLYELTFRKDKWQGEYFLLQPEEKYINGDSTMEYLKGPMPLFILKHYQVTPNNGWKYLMDSLRKLEIYTIPGKDEIPGMVVTWTDAGSTRIEIASMSNFRFYEYSDPHRFASAFPQANKVSTILQLLHDELLK